jgi:hypothetical protein
MALDELLKWSRVLIETSCKEYIAKSGVSTGDAAVR